MQQEERSRPKNKLTVFYSQDKNISKFQDSETLYTPCIRNHIRNQTYQSFFFI
jgi:hypothetical protein